MTDDLDDQTYIDAYCQQAEKVLTVRLDRVLRIHAPSPFSGRAQGTGADVFPAGASASE